MLVHQGHLGGVKAGEYLNLDWNLCDISKGWVQSSGFDRLPLRRLSKYYEPLGSNTALNLSCSLTYILKSTYL